MLKFSNNFNYFPIYNFFSCCCSQDFLLFLIFNSLIINYYRWLCASLWFSSYSSCLGVFELYESVNSCLSPNWLNFISRNIFSVLFFFFLSFLDFNYTYIRPYNIFLHVSGTVRWNFFVSLFFRLDNFYWSYFKLTDFFISLFLWSLFSGFFHFMYFLILEFQFGPLKVIFFVVCLFCWHFLCFYFLQACYPLHFWICLKSLVG